MEITLPNKLNVQFPDRIVRCHGGYFTAKMVKGSSGRWDDEELGCVLVFERCFGTLHDWLEDNTRSVFGNIIPVS